MLLLTTVISAQEKSIENPPFSVRNNVLREIRKIVLNNKRTEVHLAVYAAPYPWFSIPQDAYLRVNTSSLFLDLIHPYTKLVFAFLVNCSDFRTVSRYCCLLEI